MSANNTMSAAGAGAAKGTSLAYHLAPVPVPAAVPASLDAATGQVEHDDFIVVPYTGPAQAAYDDTTAPGDFDSMAEYRVYCAGGAKVRLAFNTGKIGANGKPEVHELLVSKKFLQDFGEYFKKAFTNGFKETETSTIQYIDINILEFQRLVDAIHHDGPHVGNPNESMTEVVATLILADRFQMPVVCEWLQSRINIIMAINQQWKAVYHHQVVDQPVPGAADKHTAQISDFINAWYSIKGMLEPTRPCDPDFLCDYIIKNCPKTLFMSIYNDLDPDFIRDFCKRAVEKCMTDL